jgi:hypothetical protein
MMMIALLAGVSLCTPDLLPKRHVTARRVAWAVVILFGGPPIIRLWITGVMG